MKKMKLSLDDLKVESFQTTPENDADREGTVFGFISPGPGNTCDPGCTDTLQASCNGTCDDPTCSTCGSTCGSSCGCPPVTCIQLCGTVFACHICTNYQC